MTLKTKKCSKCHETLPLDSFSSAGKKGGKSAWCKYCKNTNATKYYHKLSSKEKAHITRVRVCRKYGLTPDAYEAMFLGQLSACAICKQPSSIALHVDHCHQTGRVRGLLCRNCNVALGHFKDNPTVLRTAADYLEGTRYVEG